MASAWWGVPATLGLCVHFASVAGAGCTSSGNPSGTSSTRAAVEACDPLSVDAAPIALAVVIGAGRAADGTVYVLDRGPAGNHTGVRAFISDGAVLRRRKVFGSGESGDVVSVLLDADPTTPLQVKVESANGTATRMGVFRGPADPKTKSFEIGAQGEELTLLPAGELSTFTVANVSDVRVMYAATTNDGHRFIAFTPEVDATDDDVRVFYGTGDRMLQRKVLSISHDSSIHLEFDLDGVRTMAQLTFCGSWMGWGPPRLQPEGGSAIPLTPVPGSPGSGDCSGFGAGDGGDGGDASTPPFPPAPPAEPAALVAGLRFYCF